MEIRRAILDVPGRRLSEAKQAEEGGCTPLPTSKYEPDMVKTDRDIKVRNRMEKKRFLVFFGPPRSPGYSNLAVAMFIKFCK